MTEVYKLTFNPFSENTYIVADETGECIIVDPGCYDPEEEEELAGLIEQKGLRPVKLVLTHSHIDHVLGNSFVCSRYQVPIYAHTLAPKGLQYAEVFGQFYGIRCKPSPEINMLMEEGDVLTFGNTRLESLYCPGHSPDSLVFYHREQGFVLAGDVLFYGSIGRTDLPGGSHEQLLDSIRTKLFTLPPETLVYNGHGPETEIGHEMRTNPFLQ